MPKPAKNETVQCVYFRWKLYRRKGSWYADGRSNDSPRGRHSLDTTSLDEARRFVAELDRVEAVKLGLALPLPRTEPAGSIISVPDGFARQLADIRGRERTESLSPRTSQRYEPVADKFSSFCKTRGVQHWNNVNAELVRDYVIWLDDHEFAYATQYFEVTFIKQCAKFLIAKGQLAESCRVVLKMHRPEESDRYCYNPAEVAAMLERCQSVPTLKWLGHVITGLATTGMRIGELASLRWCDIDVEKNMIRLTDERHSVARRKQGTARELKGKRSRALPISGQLAALLPLLRRHRDGIVFRGSDDAPLNPDVVRKTFDRKVLAPLSVKFPTLPGAASGFANGCLHSFRHYFCSISANAGVQEQALMSWLGHRSSKLIRRYYHLHDEASQQAMQKIVFLHPAIGVEAPSAAS